AKVTTTDDAGNTTTATDEKPYDVDVTPPEAEIVTITGTVGKDVKAGDTVTVTVNGKDYTTTVNADGKTWNGLVDYVIARNGVDRDRSFWQIGIDTVAAVSFSARRVTRSILQATT
ncbi:hypothetical protein D0C27_19285, partial [Alcaligenes faecalis]|uniref:hypothetical protein n=1 Tax=Alcaligenes faecalis TaxID=511 RepID=UPI0010CA39D3